MTESKRDISKVRYDNEIRPRIHELLPLYSSVGWDAYTEPGETISSGDELTVV
ncbi:hypothetical protein [Actinobaculum sp. 352]|uniref:hypothetical protein n=1 Tax=Actinobaculum sp. 352 TaxID=2490946 RepID=UPI0013E0B811|nr:hypothetical protein [Actinobaculum sp. 352]